MFAVAALKLSNVCSDSLNLPSVSSLMSRLCGLLWGRWNGCSLSGELFVAHYLDLLFHAAFF
jgi:hypothetical protein